MNLNGQNLVFTLMLFSYEGTSGAGAAAAPSTQKTGEDMKLEF
jgi:hypothetical protein